MTDARTTPAARATYRHGDLRRALVEAGVELARDGGPDAVVLREATRRVGVAPNAAYRHFADRQALLAAVCTHAQSELAGAMRRSLIDLPTLADPVATVRARMRAAGYAYLSFAVEESGLFRTAYSVPQELRRSLDPPTEGAEHTAFSLLNALLDELVAAGSLSPARRKGAEFIAWSAVHGLAILLLDGPLRELDPSIAPDTAERLLEIIELGL
ncbi:TetR/AcrR family transcriptional regulator [Pseudonocardia spinosispora]|uniref:TetR/AcrR family transcriptional regulator n=1 Tax=Pseudonocardia spinosispora TaxID=103441 RepID=UPI00040D767A|nr:TetR/AcrR family transcriptional regulator [Pseudonocardia spinosispora]